MTETETPTRLRTRRQIVEDELFHAEAAYRAAQDALADPATPAHTLAGLYASASYYAQQATRWRGELARLKRIEH